MIKTYYGIADCHGLESFICIDDYKQKEMLSVLEGDSKPAPFSEMDIITTLLLRARYNDHRHPVVYTAKVSSKDDKKIVKLMKAGKHADALIYLKNHAKEISIENGLYNKIRWEKIPNRVLDPYE